MAIREIRKNGDEILRKQAKKVEAFDERLQLLIDDMIETLHDSNGVGLAAQQVGLLKQIVVIDIYDGSDPIILINPMITKTKGEHEVEEGCLSFPNEYATVIRPKEVEVEAQDRKGKKIKVKGKDLLAQALCHELDHLQGKLFVDIMIPGTKQYVTPE